MYCMEFLKVAVIQGNVQVNMYEENLNIALKKIDQCAKDGAKLICLPEAFATSLDLPRVKSDAQSIDGEICTRLCESAKRNNVFIIGGFLEEEAENVYSTAVLISDTGIIIGKYRRKYIYKLEQHFIKAGDSTIIVETKIGKIGLILGYDINFPEITREMFKQRVDIIACPLQVPFIFKEPTRQLAVARATENSCYFILASSSGKNTLARIKYMGGSLIAQNSVGLEVFSTDYVKQKGILASAENDEEIIYAKLNMTKLRREISENPHYLAIEP